MLKTTFNPLIKESEIETVTSSSSRKRDEENQTHSSKKTTLFSPVRNNPWESNYGEREEDYIPERSNRVGYRTYFAAFLLFFGGLVLVVLGAVEYWDSQEPKGLDLFVIGVIMLLPGTYGMTIVIGHLKGWLGYDSGSLPLYD